MFANKALLGGGVRVRVWIREQRKIKRRSKALLSLWWQTWSSLELWGECWVLSLSLSTSSSSRCLQFPQHYAAISETNQPAELIPQFSTIEYQLQVMHAQPPRFISLSSKLSSLVPLFPYLVDLHLSFIPSPCLLHTLFLSAFRCCPHHLPLCCGYLPGWRKPSSSQGIILMVVTTESVLYVWASFWLLFTVNLNTCINIVYLYKCNTHCQCLRVSVVDYNQELTFLLHRSLSSSLWACFHPLPSLASSPLAEWWANFKSFLLLGQSQGSECSRTSESLLIQKTMFMTVLLCINFWSLVQS